MKRRNPTFGFPRIAQQINLALGITIDKDVVRRVLAAHYPRDRYHQCQANLRILDIKEIKSIPYTRSSHPFIKRLIGTIRRQYLNRQRYSWQSDCNGLFQTPITA